MKKYFCIIEKEKIDLDQVFVTFNEIPIFFLCKTKGKVKWYLGLANLNQEEYYLFPATDQDIYHLLHGKTPIRDIFLTKKEYWVVPDEGEVVKHSISDLSVSDLPEENCCFEVLTEEMTNYVKKFDDYYYKKERN